MKYSEFIAGVKACPDDQLHERFGIFDNFPVLLKAPAGVSIHDLVAALRSHPDYAPYSLEQDVDCQRTLRMLATRPDVNQERFKESYTRRVGHSLSNVVVSPRDTVNVTMTSDDCFSSHVIDFQKQNYDCEFMLHPYKAGTYALSAWRAMCIVIEDIANHVLLPRQIPFCLPKIFHYSLDKVERRIPQDYSTIVVSPDEDESTFQRLLK